MCKTLLYEVGSQQIVHNYDASELLIAITV